MKLVAKDGFDCIYIKISMLKTKRKGVNKKKPMVSTIGFFYIGFI